MSMTAFEIFGVLKLNKDSFDKGLKEASSDAKGAGSKIGGALATGAKVGLAALTAATGATVAFAKSAVTAGSAFDTAMGGVAATMGKSVEEVGAEIGTVKTAYGEFNGTLRDFAMFMGQNTVFSASEAAAALNYMALAGYKTQESMQMLPAVLSMAAAGSMDLALASDMITDTQSALGLSFDRTKQMVDEFAKAASSGNTNVQQLGEAFLKVGGLAKNLNGGMITMSDGTQVAVDGVQELEIALTAMANAGVKGNEAGTHMRNMLLKLSSPTSDGAVALEKLGVAVFDAQGNMNSLADIFGDMSVAFSKLTQQQKLSYISDLFNTRDLASAEALLAAVEGTYVRMGDEVMSLGTAQEKYGDAIYDTNAGFEIMQSTWDRLGESILDAEGAADQMSKTKLNNLAGDIKLFKSALETAHIVLNDQLTPSLRDFVQFGTEGLQKITQGFQEGGLEGAMAAFGEILSQGLNMIIEKLPSFIDAGSKLLGALAQGLFDNLDVIIESGIVVLEKLAEAFVEGIPAIIDALGRIVTRLLEYLDENLDPIIDMIFVFLDKCGDAIMKHLPKILSLIGKITIKLINRHAQELPRIIAWIGQALKSAANYISSNAGTIAETAIELVNGLLNGLLENLPALIEGALALIMALADGLLQALPVLVEQAPVIIKQLVDALVANMPMILDTAVKLIVTLATGILENLDIILPAAIEIVVTLIRGIIQMLPQIVQAAIDLVVGLVGGIISSLPDILAAGVKIVAELIKGIAGALGDLIGSGLEIIGSVLKGIGDAIAGIWDAGVDAVKKFGEGIASVIADALQWGKDLVNNFIDGIASGATALWDKVTDLAAGIADRLGFSEPKIGPLSNFHTYAPDMMDLFAKGIVDNEDMLYNTVEDAFDFQDAINGGSPQLNANMGNLGVSGGIYGEAGLKDIVIPVYIGDKLIDEIIVDARQRIVMKSGGLQQA